MLLDFETFFKSALYDLKYPNNINITNIITLVKCDIIKILAANNNRDKLKEAAKVLQTRYNISEVYETGKV